MSAGGRHGVAVRGSVGLGVPAGVARQAELLVSFALPSESATFGVRIGGSSSGDGTVCALACSAARRTPPHARLPRGQASVAPSTTRPAPPTPPSRAAARTPRCRCEPTPAHLTAGEWQTPGVRDSLPLLARETSVELRVFAGAGRDPPRSAEIRSRSRCCIYTPTTLPFPSSAIAFPPAAAAGKRGRLSTPPPLFADWTFVEAYFQRGRVAITAKAAFSPDTVASLTSNVTVAADVSLSV